MVSGGSSLLELRVFSCGNGDTILVRWPGPKWAVIDCRLPKGPVRGRVFDYFERENIRQLEFVCLTHPDLDHLLGMADLVSHFTTNNRRIKHFCHPPADSKTIGKILRWARKKNARSEYRRLIEVLEPLLKTRKVKRLPISSNSGPIVDEPRLRLVPLSPDPNTDFNQVLAGLRHLSSDRIGELSVVEDTNAISIVLVATVQTGPGSISVLLSGDLPAEEWPWALDAWEQKAKASGCETRFRVVKVPHHGSIDSHEPRIALTFAGPKSRFAVISVGHSRPQHPDRRVLEGFVASGWEVLLTAKRQPVVRHHPLGLSTQSQARFERCEGRDVIIAVHSDGTIVATPEEAFLALPEIRLYGQATAASPVTPR